MKKLKLIFASFFFVCFSLFFTSCDSKDLLDNVPPLKIPLTDISIDIPLTFDTTDTPTPDAALKSTSADFYSFSGESGSINLQNEMFEKLKQYENSSIELLVSDVKVKIETQDGGTIVRNFTSTTRGDIVETYTKEGDINVGGAGFSDTELTNHMQKIFGAIQNNKTVNIEVSGKTNIDPNSIESAEVVVVTIIPSITAQIKLIK